MSAARSFRCRAGELFRWASGLVLQDKAAALAACVQGARRI